ncbi:MAG: dTDP-4-dehydrorhamnose reductase [Planctomycetota bacterium]|jgi:dTDP-4-dehydrorhamnose reductase|nr:dTDP-4-dehydrorhamnose reductase [Planctomycetota bacterium]
MRILLTGAKGMLGRHLARELEGHELLPVDIDDFDLADAVAVERAVAAFEPGTVIHCAAMTAVDRAEAEPDAAFRVNAVGGINIAASCQRHGARLIAMSTDYVFSGDLGRPYHEWDSPRPRTVYGQSKLAGEDGIRAHCPNHLILRLAWLYGAGGPSFVHAMLEMGGQDGPPLKVVEDQRGNPTSALAVAERLVRLLDIPLVGTMHFSCSGETTWYGFAKEIFAQWGLAKRELTPCTTGEFPRPAPRPANSCLERRRLRLAGQPDMPDWRDALEKFRKAYPDG